MEKLQAHTQDEETISCVMLMVGKGMPFVSVMFVVRWRVNA